MGARLTVTGDKTWAGDAEKRTRTGSMRQGAIKPWMKWKTQVAVIDQYRAGGRVRGPDGQPRLRQGDPGFPEL